MATVHKDLNYFEGGIRVEQSVGNVTDAAPTLAELTSIFGDPAKKGRGWLGTIDDADGDTNMFLITVSDASYYYIKLTKAV